MTLDELAEDRSRKKIILDALGMKNISGLTLEERVRFDVEYERATRIYELSDREYRRAVRKAAS